MDALSYAYFFLIEKNPYKAYVQKESEKRREKTPFYAMNFPT